MHSGTANPAFLRGGYQRVVPYVRNLMAKSELRTLGGGPHSMMWVEPLGRPPLASTSSCRVSRTQHGQVCRVHRCRRNLMSNVAGVSPTVVYNVTNGVGIVVADLSDQPPDPEGEPMAETLAEELGSAIRRYRDQDLQLSQADLAWLAEVSRGTISNLETGRNNPDDRTWHRVRTALALRDSSLTESPPTIDPLMPAVAVKALIDAILEIREQDLSVGERVARRWRQLMSDLSREDYSPTAGSVEELAWLARDVMIKALPEHIEIINRALRNYGWSAATEHRSRPDRRASGLDQREERLLAALRQVSAQLAPIREGLRGFERLPVRIQDLLNRGLVVDYDVLRYPGFSVIDLLVVEEDYYSFLSRNQLLRATRQWSSTLMLAQHIMSALPEIKADEIIEMLNESLDRRKHAAIENPDQETS